EMLDQLDPQTVLLNAGKIADSSSQMLKSDLPGSELGAFADLALTARGQEIATLSVVPPQYNTESPDFDQVRADVQALINGDGDAGEDDADEGGAETEAPEPEAPETDPNAPEPEPTDDPDAN